MPPAAKLALGAGEGVINLNINLPNQLANPVFNLYLGVNPLLVGLALTIPRLWDGLTDAVMGHISDNTSGKRGRRRPYLLVGGLSTAVFAIVLWMFPSGRSEAFYFSYLLVSSILLYTAMTVYAVPYGAMVMEATSDYHERTRLMTVRFFFTYLTLLAVQWLFAITQLDLFPTPVAGARAAGVIVAVLTLACALMPFLFSRERPPAPLPTGTAKLPFFSSMRETLSNRAFLVVVGVYTLGFLGTTMTANLGLYTNIYYVHGGDARTASVVQGWAGTTGILAAMTMMPLLSRFGTRVDKRRALSLCLGLALCGAAGSWFLYHPAHPYLQLAVKGMISPGLCALLIFSSSMLADICDQDRLRTGLRREGTYWAVFNWIQKTALSLSFSVTGFILLRTGFDAALPEQGESTVFWIRAANTSIMTLSLGAALLLLTRYPLTEARVREIRRECAARGMG
jgi:GPH family glycoside/pentoside/hexuronide:cation symporter